MKIAISGASGLIGKALMRSLERDGHVVQPLVRGESDNPHAIRWAPHEGSIETEKLVGTDALVHLAGEPLVGLRWTEDKKRRIMRSRVEGTGLVAHTLAQLDGGPRVLISASGVNYYGETTDWVDEDSPLGEGFLAEVCEAWEQAADPAREAGLRVVHPRMGPALTPEGGALEKMLPVFKMGLGGPVGDGQQYFSWVAIDDVVGAIRFLIDGELDGPVNVVSPNPVTNAEFTETLASTLGRPSFMRLPDFAVHAALGKMGEETLLRGQRVRPARLLAAGYHFRYEHLRPALEHLLAG